MSTERPAVNNKARVVVAMSGGVDSSVAAALLVEEGYDVVGIMMRLWSDSLETAAPVVNRCCTPDQMADARRVADHLNIPFYVLDAQSQFREAIVQPFIDDHQHGRTPNPCIACNRKIRFGFLLQHAQALGAQFMATGHYARKRENNGSYQLIKGMDSSKDQSYVLYTLNQQKLAHVLFPVGEFEKAEVREMARKFDLPVASKHDSQDLCFVVDGDNKGFLQRYAGNGFSAGPIVDQSGSELGRHDGLPFYTIGQRKGLGISSSQPLYVLRKDFSTNRIIVGPREALHEDLLHVRDLNWISGTAVSAKRPVQIKIRYKTTSVTGHIHLEDNGEALVRLMEPVSGVTPGQGAVFYDGEVCLGGGIIADLHSSCADRTPSTEESTGEH
ncbi:MAG: tRNA 2-thiouridine(34) synthase MnmA [Candidatus Promineifilaceae bacterium]